MRTRVIVYAALLSLGFVIPAWATPRTLPVSPAQEKEAPLSCHESVVHIRGNHRTRSLAELRGRVSHWANALHLRWGREEVEEVVTHLNDHYYKFESRQK
ncbi:MAG TPA: hypothetical protein VK945_08780 [Planococcus sp. (in: firmicutes)]|nr:hypothetical protein [Planococcus sp. (in: firmicutes)]